MAVGSSRTLKLTILGDVDQLKKSLSAANTDVEQSSSRLGDFSKKAGLAFAAAGVAAAAYAGKLLIDGVKSAIEDEAAQAKLATTLKNVAGATDATVAATEAYILKTSLATGTTDNELRPSLERLARSTGDLQKAQELQTLALDIAAGSGKSLEAVSNALGKSFEGNSGALAKLGIGLSAAELKTMSFDQVAAALANTFAGQASVQADTFAGKMQRLSVAFDEGKETVGSFVLDAITPMLTTLVNDVIPKISEFALEIGENLKPTFEALTTYFTDVLLPTFLAIYNFIKDFIFPIIAAVLKPAIEGLTTAFGAVTSAIKNNQTTFDSIFVVIKAVASFVRDVLAPAFGTTLKVAFTIIGTLATGLVESFGFVVDVIIKVINAIKSLISLVQSNPLVKGIGNLIENAFGGKRAMGGPVVGGNSYLVGERGAELFTPSQNGTITPNNRLGGNTINITVNGAIDSEGTARQIINVLNNSFYRGTSGAAALVTS
jgi:hypothetical protein